MPSERCLPPTTLASRFERGLQFPGAGACPSERPGAHLRSRPIRTQRLPLNYLQRTTTRSVPRKLAGRRISGFKRALLCTWGALLLGCGALWAWDIRDMQLADLGIISGFAGAGVADFLVALAGRAPETRRRFLTFKAGVVLLNLIAIIEAAGIVAIVALGL